jgi:hypothetical protein
VTAWTPEPLTPFDEITARLPQLSALQAVWNEAEELLQAAHPEGFDVLEIGRMVWDCLPEGERPAALDALFYCWFEALMSDREARNTWTEGSLS